MESRIPENINALTASVPHHIETSQLMATSAGDRLGAKFKKMSMKKYFRGCVAAERVTLE